jgi:hypothetical protein
MADLPIKVEGDDYLALGSNSYTNPQKLDFGEYVEGMNLMNRGGLPQTRPGSITVFTIPDGNFQGMTLFKPSSGIPHLVFMVDGLVYVSPFPFYSFRQLYNLKFSLDAKFAAWATCLKSTDYTPDGTLYYLDSPYSVLIIQDGLTKAAYWDGAVNRHLDPAPSNQEATLPGKDETPLGLWMSWSNNRLWVSRNDQIYASDIGNPLKFTEAQYLNEARAFYLPGNCTGIVETSDQQGILCFTDNTGTFLQSSIQDRTKWLSTPQFQKTILPNTGCAAPRSIVQQYGLIWWYSPKGLINLNDALRTNITSRLDVQDNEMFASKYNMSYDLSGICGAYYENFLLQSVPNGDRFNTRTLVLDQAPFDGPEGTTTNSWPAYWTGWRPIEWAKGVIDGEERIYMASKDFDGKNRIWEAFRPERTDNGVPITCYLVTRYHLFGDREHKKHLWSEVEMREISGDVWLQISISGIRGAFQPMATKKIVSTVGQVYADEEYGEGAHLFAATKPQGRTIKTIADANPSECNEVCVETDKRGLIDIGFCAMILWSGIAGLGAYRIFCENYPENLQGNCEVNESGPRLLTPDGCGALDIFNVADPFETFIGEFTAQGVNPLNGNPISYTAFQTSHISQANADEKAQLAAEIYVTSQIQQLYNAG